MRNWEVLPNSVGFREDWDPEPRLNWFRRLFDKTTFEGRHYLWLTFRLQQTTGEGQCPNIVGYVVPIADLYGELRRLGLNAGQVGVIALRLEHQVKHRQWPVDSPQAQASNRVRGLWLVLTLEETIKPTSQRSPIAIETT